MLGLIIGMKPIFCAEEEIPSDAPLIVYGGDHWNSMKPFVCITEDNSAENFFLGRRVKSLDEKKEISIFGRRCLSLFNDINQPILASDSPVVGISSDIIATAFYFLSLFEEFVTDQRDQFDRFEAKNSFMQKSNSLYRPIVSEIAGVIKAALEKIGVVISKGGRYFDRRSAVCLTHDIDYISKWSPGIAYREFIKFFLFNQSRALLDERIHRLKYFMKSVSKKHDPYKVSLRQMLDWEKKHKFHATYFFKTGGNDKRDVSYNVYDSFIQKIFLQLKELDFEIGLHPSFNTYVNPKMWSEELQGLSLACQRSILTSRQHYLRLRYPQTYRIIEANNQQYDSSLGFAEVEGFRNGTCHPFLPYDLEQDRVLRFWEIPLHVMDGTLAAYQGLDATASFELIERLNIIVDQHEGMFTLLIHNTCCDMYEMPGWSDIFESYLHGLAKKNIVVTTIPKTVQAWIESWSCRDLSEVVDLIEKA